jgi:hypothetical protein
MPSRRLAWAAAVLVVFGGGAVSGVSASSVARGAQCAHRSGKTLALTRNARVFDRTPRALYPERHVYACLLTGGPLVDIGRDDRGGEFTTTHLTLGTYNIAYFDQYAGRSGAAFRTIVRDLHTGKATTVSSFEDDPNDAISYVGARLVLATSGAAGWVTKVGGRLSAKTLNVEVHVGHGRFHQVLDRGAHIDAGSLALHGDAISWRHDGESKTAALP